ncbi:MULTISPECIES: PTS sugar transporter subunit IIA [Lactobacillus]|uniref:PTS sugar transporter subunit IIA n=1 Tax=Lactobacillus xujianguonis TaxID=2495899 RepID=A0A437SVW9_9LACO|nr:MULTISPECIES: PTS sugar transporter subunit IIA [Lactobacillus]RVU71042.1 PTS sugar transporter subunit IIA [Lactobacillus xujianguonis]RVU76802.1 PTS sugar transporter subunit IIA [Lactobacillus xujianguonis]
MENSVIFARDAVFVTDETEQDDLLKEIYDHLLQQGYVKGNFLAHIIEREHNFPTGLDTSTLGSNLPNIAIPHTEGAFVNTRLIVPVALKTPVIFHNMIKPEQELPVKFLFMLLETNPDGQAKLLSQVMDFLAKTPAKDLQHFLNFDDPDAIYEYLMQNFA